MLECGHRFSPATGDLGLGAEGWEEPAPDLTLKATQNSHSLRARRWIAEFFERLLRENSDARRLRGFCLRSSSRSVQEMSRIMRNVETLRHCAR